MLALVLALAACAVVPTPAPRYHLGQPYQASGVWHYPGESYDLNETGLGSVMPDGHEPLTTNGEVYDPSAMAAAHPTLQLPAIARLTNLENGLSTTVRINDRGSGNPHRLVEFTPRVGVLLRIQANAVAQVRLTVLGNESRDAVAAVPGAPLLDVASAPRGRVDVIELPPPPGVAASARAGDGGTRSLSGKADDRPAMAPPALPPVGRLPETLTQETPQPGRLMVRLGTFEGYQYAAIQRARVAGLRPNIVQVDQGRSRRYRVEIGPFPSVPAAEMTQDQALKSGVPDARIVVD